MNFEQVKQNLSAARGDTLADTVLKNGNIINVLSGEIHEGDIAINNGKVVGIGSYRGIHEVDIQGMYAAPGLIDGHIHLESTMLSVHEFARAVVPHGTTAVVVDPHEFANVLGVRGIEYVLESAGDVPVDIFVMASSCVPATPLESAGASITHDELKDLLQRNGVVGVAELMNFPGVFLGWDHELKKIELGKKKPIDGHSPGLRGNNLSAYILAGVSSDHECTTLEEARDKLRKGMHILMREGTAERNLLDLLPLVTPENAANFSFATDDKHPGDLMDEGHIDHHIREAVAFGISPIIAVQMATINTARHYQLEHHGAIAPGYWADIVLVDDLLGFNIRKVFKRGEMVAQQNSMRSSIHSSVNSTFMRDTMNAAPFSASDFAVQAQDSAKMKVIEVVPRQIITKTIIEQASVENGLVQSDTERDILKLVVIERHKATGNIGVGFVKGFGLKSGAIASTVAHDAHNIIVLGTNDDDIAFAAKHLLQIQGGQCVVNNGVLQDDLPLPIAGLVSDQPLEYVRKKVDDLIFAAKKQGCILSDPFMTLSFLALSPIPELKVTDQGLVDATNFKLTDLFVSP
jgi:adenine deaminase